MHADQADDYYGQESSVSKRFSPGDIVVILEGRTLTGHIGVVKGEGNVWDYTVAMSNGDTWRFDPEKLAKITVAELIKLASPVSPQVLAFLG